MIDTATIDVVLADDESINLTVSALGLNIAGIDDDKIHQG
jgi:hypothetical protein